MDLKNLSKARLKVLGGARGLYNLGRTEITVQLVKG